MRENIKRGIKRGKFRITGADVRDIFDPIVDEIIDLIDGQIKATKTKIKAVLLVGGLGQNTYVRNCVRNALQPHIEVLQSPNGYDVNSYALNSQSLHIIVGPL